MAIAAFVLGILGMAVALATPVVESLVVAAFLLIALAAVFGVIGRRQARPTGRVGGVATSGMVLVIVRAMSLAVVTALVAAARLAPVVSRQFLTFVTLAAVTLLACKREPGKITFGRSVDDNLTLVGPATSFTAGEEFGYLAAEVRCNEANLTRRIVRYDAAAEKVTDEAEVHWEAAYDAQSDVIHIDRPGSYGVKLLCRGEVVAVGAVTTTCPRAPTKMSEWKTYLGTDSCIERQYVCEHFTVANVMNRAIEVDVLPEGVSPPRSRHDFASAASMFIYIGSAREAVGCPREQLPGGLAAVKAQPQLPSPQTRRRP